MEHLTLQTRFAPNATLYALLVILAGTLVLAAILSLLALKAASLLKVKLAYQDKAMIIVLSIFFAYGLFTFFISLTT